MTNYSEIDIILASLIAVILVLIIIFCVYICCKRKKNIKTNENNQRRISFGSEHSYMYNSDDCKSVDTYISHDFFDNV